MVSMANWYYAGNLHKRGNAKEQNMEFTHQICASQEMKAEQKKQSRDC